MRLSLGLYCAPFSYFNLNGRIYYSKGSMSNMEHKTIISEYNWSWPTVVNFCSLCIQMEIIMLNRVWARTVFVLMYFCVCVCLTRGKAATAVFNSDQATKPQLDRSHRYRTLLVGDWGEVCSGLGKSGLVWGGTRFRTLNNSAMVWVLTWLTNRGASWPYLASIGSFTTMCM